MTNEKKFEELMADKDFVEEILSMETIEQVQGGFAEQGVEISKDEVEVLGEAIEKAVKKGEALSDDELEGIAGGKLNPKVERVFKIGAGVVAAIGLAVGVKFLRGRDKEQIDINKPDPNKDDLFNNPDYFNEM